MKIKPVTSKDYLEYKICDQYIFTSLDNAGNSILRVTDTSLSEINTINVGETDKEISSVFTGVNFPVIGVIKPESLLIYNTKGDNTQEIEGSFSAGGFDDRGYLYLATREDEENYTISVYDPDFNLVVKEEFEDELYDSVIDFSYMPTIGSMTIELAAGQDGSVIYRIHIRDGEIALEEAFDSDLIMPAFTGDQNHYAAIDNDSSTWKYMTYPGHEESGELDPYDIEMFEDVEGNLEYVLIYIKENTFIVGFSQRYFLMDFNEMEILEELIIEGHEPRPTYEIFPSLEDDDTLITDIVNLEEIGDYISIYTESRECFYFAKSALG